MHLKGELEPLVLVVDFSVFSCISVADTEFDESVFTSRTMASKVLYCANGIVSYFTLRYTGRGVFGKVCLFLNMFFKII